MRKSLFRCLLYTILVLTSMGLKAQIKLASWNFNNTYTTSTSGDSTVYTPTTTAATSSLSFNSNSKFKVYPDTAVTAILNYAFNEVGTTLQQRSGYNNYVARVQYAGPCTYTVYTDGTVHKNFFQFIFPTKGYDNITVNFSFAGGQSNTADFLRLVYSTDNGASWIDAGVNYNALAGWWLYKAYSTTIAAKNKDKVIVRLLTNTASTSTSANLNIDYLRISGTVYVPPVNPVHKVTTTVSPAGAGGISISPVGNEFDEGTNVTLTASSRSFGYQFKEWQDSKGNVLSSTSPFTFKLMTDTSVVAVYQPLTTYNFNVNVTGSQWGQVSLSPAPTGGKYEAGTTVTMTVVPNNVTKFSYWDDLSTTTSRTVLVNNDVTYAATFDEIPFIAGWDFRVDSPKSSRTGDYYSDSANKGVFDMLNQDGSVASWLSHTGAFNPSLPCAYKWTAGTSFATNQRYFQTSFSTTGYNNIVVKSQIAGNYQHYLTQKMQASLDGTNFTDLKTMNVSTTTWSDFNDTLPAQYSNQNRVYIRWVPDVTSTLFGNTTDADGTALTNVFVYADKVQANDVTPPTLVSAVPAEGSFSAPANGTIVLTFDERVKSGTGNCTLGSTVLTPLFGSKTVSFTYSKLAYNTGYAVTIPAGALTDMSGNAYPGLTLNFRTMNRPVPAAKLFDAVVAKDGTGDYSTVQGAIDAAPEGRAIPWLIFVKNGRYKGHVDIPANKPYLNLIGQSRDSVIITDSRLCGKSTVFPDSTVYAVDPGATVVVKSANCYFENICFENQFGYETVSGPQALALYALNDRVIFNNCWMRSYQDTYLTAYGSTSYRHYVKDCRIEGAVDFIYGSGDVYFDKCLIYCTRPSGGYIVAPGNLAGTKWGYVFQNCTVDGPNASYTTYLGRPWANSPMASFFNTTLKIGVYPAGWWYKMGAIPAIFADYNTMDANGNPVDMSQRISNYEYDVKDANGNVINTVKGTAKSSFTDAEAAQYTYENVMSGSDGWDPRAIIEPTNAPSNVIVTSGGAISWNATDYAICYVVKKNNKVIGFTKNASFTDAAYTSGATYKVTAVAESGALSSESIAVFSGVPTQIISANTSPVNAYFENNNLVVTGLEPGSTVSVYSFVGTLLAKQTATSNLSTFNSMPSCIVKVSSKSINCSIKVMK
ncbi:pectinesterase family protein [Parabacteroides sp. FAFU027]|uniref:pectinesterase family protein n=1 Tax=Parabacteroides sp. FAFU027 TaxID=2922715 RepID=UPI001FAED116|nr:pectinesterase family protein [Parabacteroides sp. FAFU027]